MIIGIPKEIKNNENRVAMTPMGVTEFVRQGHQVLVERNAGSDSGFDDQQYLDSGAHMLDASEVWARADMIIKVKEPLSAEYVYFREGLILFAYLHLAAEPELAEALRSSGVTAIAYETIRVQGTLPLLAPMSEVAGRMAVQVGAQMLEKARGGKGILLSGVTGVKRGKVTIIGGGIAGTNAAQLAVGLGAEVTVLDTNVNRLRELAFVFGNQLQTLQSTSANLAASVAEADLVISTVLIPGGKAPKLVSEEMVKSMNKGSVIVDVAIDQGGSVETIDRITTHDDPVFVKHDVLHYAVANIPGAVPQTSTLALTNATLPFALQIAKLGVDQAIHTQPAIMAGVNTMKGSVTYEAVARDLGYDYVSVDQLT
ncbi:alanine dehydrogenase [Paenibacillus shirakamiensis]|uniref:Alanine dehydrogenase n=1 Tax=Paenibacillus shirakamiensis TaxID=1265935 RepID=A0ABS4JF23_9BACL|nr:alanine dehydrogenase [Paenibacillus shirakamiensis]MBP2000310.1 alanine dehydrogenase [Paenibacillus shirakamiensis]